MDASLLELDPTITPEMVAEAHDATPVDYDLVFAEIADRLAQDDLDDPSAPSLLSGPVAPVRPAGAIANAHAIHANNVNVGIGFCLRAVHNYFKVPALWPDAETAWENGGVFTKTRFHLTDPAQFPRGTVGYAVNDRHGHIWLNVGGGMCWTTDFRRPGFVDLAPISSMAPWIGGRLVGWAEILNGFDVWPSDNPKPPPPFGLVDREHMVHRALEHAIANHAPQRRIDGLRKWDQSLLARLDASNDHR